MLQEKLITPIGSSKSEPLDVRLITATNRPLNELINHQQFREDLLYRINTITIQVPSLKDRTEDIEPLLKTFLDRFEKKYKREKFEYSKGFLNLLKTHDWPGNIRELENVIEKCVILNQVGFLDENDLDLGGKQPKSMHSGSLEEIEKQAILKALKKHQGNMIRAARELDITRQTIYNKMKKYGL